ncbi:phage portal protein [Secundilactobacillus kimchicus]|uniref:phage portal protein n=1 Tax=Secundilactobacillus kimchicus TaxID=528209 RepID=UPI001C0308CD|nr:phage portal protein [Secundilactobacillus kimchicus]MBT9670691.1 phage portal protein [Secundilactobacillus kimchicus]
MPFFTKERFKNSLTVGTNGTKTLNFTDSEVANFLHPDKAEYISARKALQNSDIFSIIMQLSSDLATVRYTAERSRAQALIDNPSSTSNAHAFWQSVYAQLLLGGEAFAYRWRNINGVDMRWEYLRPSQVNIFLLDDGSGLQYTITFDEPDLGVLQNVPQGDILHFRLLSTNGGMTGISPLTALANELNINDASNRLTLTALAKSIVSPGVLSIEKGGLLGAKEKAARSRQFIKQVNDSEGGPVVIDSLEKYEPLEIKSNVAALLSQTDWTGTQIAKVFGVPDSYLNGQGDQQSSVDQIASLYANSLNRYASSITSEFANKLSTKVAVDLRPALDPLSNSIAGRVRDLTQSGVLAPNQSVYTLQKAGLLDENLPEATTPPMKGGENVNDKDN